MPGTRFRVSDVAAAPNDVLWDWLRIDGNAATPLYLRRAERIETAIAVRRLQRND
jgi:hypothetical protein